MRKALIATGMSLAMLGMMPAPAAQAAGPDQFEIKGLTSAGSGCPAGTATASIEGGNRFSVTYDAFQAWDGPGATPSDRDKACRLGIDVEVPAGLTYSVVEIQHRGSAYLVKGATASQRASYFWTGESETGVLRSSIDGPYDDIWQFNDALPTVKLSPQPCGSKARLNAKLNLGVHAKTAAAKKETSSISQDSADGKFTTYFQIKFFPC
jgi:hypothetical protein